MAPSSYMVSQGWWEAEKVLWCLAQLLRSSSVEDPEPWACKILPFHLAPHMPLFHCHQEPIEGELVSPSALLGYRTFSAETAPWGLPNANAGQDMKTTWFQRHGLVSLAFKV